MKGGNVEEPLGQGYLALSALSYVFRPGIARGLNEAIGSKPVYVFSADKGSQNVFRVVGQTPGLFHLRFLYLFVRSFGFPYGRFRQGSWCGMAYRVGSMDSEARDGSVV